MNKKPVLDVYKDIDATMIGYRLSSFRVKKCLSQAALAEKIGVSPDSVSGWEQGKRRFSVRHLIALSDVLGVTTDSILCLTAEDAVLQGYVYCFELQHIHQFSPAYNICVISQTRIIFMIRRYITVIEMVFQ